MPLNDPILSTKVLTTTRIPNSFFASEGYMFGFARIFFCLRRYLSDGLYDNIGIGIKKSFYQYDKDDFFSGLTPGDNGVLNDGGPDSIEYVTNSRYYIGGTRFEWFDPYVIYSYDSAGTTGDNIEIYTASDLQELIKVTKSLGLVSATASGLTEYDCLSSLITHNTVCVNTHYPDITLDTSKLVQPQFDPYVNNLRLLLDFGYIPSYPRGGSASYNISDNPNSIMRFIGSSYSYMSATNSNSGGGAVEIMYETYGEIPYNSNLNNHEGTIDVWLRIMTFSTPGNNNYILNSYDFDNHSGYAILEKDQRFTLLTGDGNTENYLPATTIQIMPEVWYNVSCTYDGVVNTLIVSNATTYNLNGLNAHTASVATFSRNGTQSLKLGYGGSRIQIGSVIYYNKNIKDKVQNLWKAYTNTLPNRYLFNDSFLGRYLTMVFSDLSELETLVPDYDTYNAWNTFFDLPTHGRPFGHIQVLGNTITLYGGHEIEITNGKFQNFDYLIAFIDNGCIEVLDDYVFSYCNYLTSISLPTVVSIGMWCFVLTKIKVFDMPLLQTADEGGFKRCQEASIFNLPKMTSIGDEGFDSCIVADVINIPSCVTLGSSVLNNNMFAGIGSRTIKLSVPTSLMSSYSGGPDEDIQILQASNTVIINNAINGSILFSGTNQYISTTVEAPGTYSTTYEMWFYQDNTSPTTQGLLQTRTSTTGSDGIDISISNGQIQITTSGSTLLTAGYIIANNWYHLAAVRNGTTSWTAYLNGSSIGSFNFSNTTGSELSLGRKSATGANEFFRGKISNFRYVKGVAVYGQAFTPSTTPLTSRKSVNFNGNPSAAVDSFQTQLLLNAYTGSFLKDYSSYNRTMSNPNGATSSTAKPF